MTRKLCSSTKGLSNEENTEYAKDFKKFAKTEKEKFLARRQQTSEEDSDDE